jgi:hypothetical protein
VLGAGLFCAVYAVLWALGDASFTGIGTTGGLPLAFAISLLAAQRGEWKPMRFRLRTD